MPQLLRLSSLLIVGLLAVTACSESATSPQASHVPGEPACHDVHGELHEVGNLFLGTTEGVISGDLVGTSAGQLTGQRLNPGGKAAQNFGTRTYTITGGQVAALIGSEFTVEFVVTTVGDLPILRATEQQTATSGVESANLTAVGTIDATDFPSFTTDLVYDGVVCP